MMAIDRFMIPRDQQLASTDTTPAIKCKNASPLIVKIAICSLNLQKTKTLKCNHDFEFEWFVSILKDLAYSAHHSFDFVISDPFQFALL